MKWVRLLIVGGKKRGVYRVLVGTFEGRMSFERSSHRWKLVLKLTLNK
jgi:hypothetical protein